MADHTPGPWEVHQLIAGFAGVDICVADPDGPGGCRPIAEALTVAVPREEAEANARLLAQAPALKAAAAELVEALAVALTILMEVDDDLGSHGLAERFVADVTRLGIGPGVGERADRAIAAAEGRPPHVVRVPIDRGVHG